MRDVTLSLMLILRAASAPSCAQTVHETTLVQRSRLRGPSIALSSDGKLLALAGSKPFQDGADRQYQLSLLDTATGRELASVSGELDLLNIVFSADGKRIAGSRHSGGAKRAHLWDVAVGPQGYRLEGQETELDSWGLLALSPDGKRVGALGNGIRVWDCAAKKELSFLRLPVQHQQAFSPDLRRLAASRYQDVDLYDLGTGKEEAALLDHPGPVVDLSFSADGKTLVALSCVADREGRDHTHVTLWDTGTKAIRQLMPQTAGRPWRMASSGDGSLLAVCLALEETRNGRHELRLLDIPSARWISIASFEGPEARPLSLACDRTGTILAASFADGSVRIWRMGAAK